VRNPKKAFDAEVHYYEIDDFLTQDKKLEVIEDFAHSGNVPWEAIRPNDHGDWINQRSEEFNEFIPLSIRRAELTSGNSIFLDSTIGIATNRDSWMYNFSAESVNNNMSRFLETFNDLLGKRKSNSSRIYQIYHSKNR
jgi:predicted helicase